MSQYTYKVTSEVDIHEDGIRQALDCLVDAGLSDGSHHKQWEIDQAIRAILKEGYPEFIEYLRGQGYEWGEGVPP